MTAHGPDATAPVIRCGCCDRALPAGRATELAATPGIFICRGCARWAARRASRRPNVRRAALRIAHDVVGPLAPRRRRTFRSAIPILPSADLDRTIAFWDRVGFRVVQRYEDYLVTSAEDVELHFALRQRSSPAGEAAVEGPGSAFVHVRDAGALWKRLRASDVAGLGPVADRDYGIREFVVTDLDGNRVRFGSSLTA